MKLQLSMRQGHALMHPIDGKRFRTDYGANVGPYRTVITCNLNDNPPTWHASIMRRGGGVPVPLSAMLKEGVADMRRVAHELLVGVGEGDDEWEEHDDAIHLRRWMTPAELTAARDPRRRATARSLR